MRQDDDALPPHKREGYAESLYEAADAMRKAQKEEALLASWQNELRSERIADAKRIDKERHEAAIKWAISTGAKP